MSYFYTDIPMKLSEITESCQILLFVPECMTWFDMTLQNQISLRDSLRGTQMQEYWQVL